jgi:TPR repeat protein
MYKYGEGVPQNYEEAFKWYSLAAKQGNAWAQNNLGVMHQNGQAVQRNVVEAYKWYCLSAAQGNTNAIRNRDGLRKSMTPEQIADGEREAANPRPNPESVAAAEFERVFYERYPDLKPHVSLCDAVALKLHEAGFRGESREAVMEKFAEEARKELARQRGSQPAAAVNQASPYDIGKLKSAAENGDAVAQNTLGVMYQVGRGVSQDMAEAFKWYCLAAQQGNTNAANNRANLLPTLSPEQTGEGSWRRFLFDARRFADAQTEEEIVALKTSAEQGDSKAQLILGGLYCSGGRFPQNYAEALQWWRKAADQGLGSAQNSIGWLYSLGRGVPQSWEEANKWFYKAAQQGEAVAQSNLGEAFEYGRGVPQDNINAYAWYSIAAEQSEPDAIVRRNNLARRLTPEQIAEARQRVAQFKVRR